MPFVLKYAGADGTQKEYNCEVDVYKKAADAGMTLRQYMRTQIHDHDSSRGDIIDQMMTSACMNDAALGFGSAMTMAELAGMADHFRRPDGTDNSLGARLLYPQMILETLNANMFRDDGSDILSIWPRLVAISRNINGTKVDQPIIDTHGPEESRSQRIAQLAEPVTMVSITTGDKSYRIPTYSIGLTISDEAMAATTIDLVRLVMEAQSRGNRIADLSEQLRSMVLGDIDRGISPLPTTKIGVYDPAGITTDGTITKRAYIKWLHAKQKKANISTVLTDIDTAITVDEALLPKVVGQDASKIATPWGGLNLGLTQPEIIPFDVDVFGAGMLVGMDPRYAIQRFVNISASYDAIQEYVMRKATSFRVDYGEMATRLHDEAWDVVSLEKAD